MRRGTYAAGTVVTCESQAYSVYPRTSILYYSDKPAPSVLVCQSASQLIEASRQRPRHSLLQPDLSLEE